MEPRNETLLTDEQNEAAEDMLASGNINLTGPAGSGKTTTINEFKHRNKKELMCLAPTGMCAMNIEGATIHSAFSFPINTINMDILVNAALENKSLFERVDTLLIDEISMVRVEIFEAIEQVLRKCGDPSLPFGGKKIIVCGDFKQLPPIVAEPWIGKQLTERYGGEYAFHAPAWKKAKFKNIILKEIHRQRDKQFLDVLNAIRSGEQDLMYDAISIINKNCYRPNVPINSNTSFLCCTRASVKEINEKSTMHLGTGRAYYGKVNGKFPDDLPVEPEIVLHAGQQVMLAKNEYREDGKGFVNGDMGIILEIDPVAGLFVTVQLADGRILDVPMSTWLNHSYRLGRQIGVRKHVDKMVIGSYKQIPMIPSGALSIHRSQGKTLDRVHIVPGPNGFFTPWHFYVAASRCRSMENLSIERYITPADFMVDQRVIKFYNNLEV
ncbi:MAG: DEAD/DEAH box helicase [Victivallaceae bacterium]|nr:DEAD/DEAH box helicase [Victivallaceae bacterium]